MTKKKFHLENSNGFIRGVISLPSEKPIGVVVCLHGTPGGNYHGNENVFDQLVPKITQFGFVVIQFSMYGSEPSDGNQAQNCIRTQVIDYYSVLAYAQRNFECPLHVIGESAGATIASLNWSKLIQSYVLLWPAFDLKNTDLNPYLNNDWWLIVDKDGFLKHNGIIIGKEFFIELLLTDFSDSFLLPDQDILIVHGQADNEVPFSQSLKALSNAKSNIKFVTKKNAGHGFKELNDRKFVLDEVELWFKNQSVK